MIHLSVKIAIALLIPAIALGYWVQPDGEDDETLRIKISGQITPQLVEKFKQMPAGIDVIEISSQGGDTKSALEIGRLIRKRGYSLQITKYCLSACAQWLMPAAKSVTVNDGAIVAMHMSATWMRDTLKKSGDLEAAEKYNELAEQEAAYYNDMEVDADMLVYPYIGKQAICYISAGKLAEEYPVVASKFNNVILTNETYLRFTDQNVFGKWPDEPTKIGAAIEKNIPPAVKLSLALETTLAKSDTPRIVAVPKCTDDQIGVVGSD